MFVKSTIWLINFYQKYLSPDQSIFSRGRKYCVYEPSCSEYIKLALLDKGMVWGVLRGIKRIMSCHPWQKKYFDPYISESRS